MTSQARAVDDVTVGLECWTTHHVLLYALPSAVSLAIYVTLSFRLLRAGKALAAIELTPTNLFDFRADSNMPRHYAHPLSTQSVFSDILTVAVKIAIVTAEVTLGSTQPIAMSSVVFVCSGVLAATTAAKPPYFGGGAALANRMQLCVQMGVAWTCFVTLLAVLDADTVADSSNSSSTNSDRLMLLPYGILPAMLIGLWAGPQVSRCAAAAARRKEDKIDKMFEAVFAWAAEDGSMTRTSVNRLIKATDEGAPDEYFDEEDFDAFCKGFGANPKESLDVSQLRTMYRIWGDSIEEDFKTLKPKLEAARGKDRAAAEETQENPLREREFDDQ